MRQGAFAFNWLRGVWLLVMCLFILSSVAAQVKVACVGNSITYGYGTANPLTDAYPAQLQELLGEGYEVGNFGRSGTTLLRRGHRPYVETEEFRKALAFKGDVVVMHLGVNDTDPRDWPLYRDDFIPDYMALIDSFRVANPHCRILIARLSPLGVHHYRFESGTRDWQWQVQEAIEQVAHNTGVELIDFHRLLYAYPHLIEDNIHPVKEGLGMMAAYVKCVLTGDFGGLRLPEAYSSRMVLPHGRRLTVKGTDNAGAQVRVSVYENRIQYSAGARRGKQPLKKKRGTANLRLVEQQTVVTSALGEWAVELQPLAAGGPYLIEFADGTETIRIEDVLAGEVWLCSGQSNMAFQLRQDERAGEEVAAADRPQLRLLNLKPRWLTNRVEWKEEVLDSINRLEYFQHDGWQLCTPEHAADFSAVGYYFGRMLADSLQLPVGLICNAVGGAGTEAFIDRKTLEFEFPAILRRWLTNDFIQDWVRERAALNIAKALQRPAQGQPGAGGQGAGRVQPGAGRQSAGRGQPGAGGQGAGRVQPGAGGQGTLRSARHPYEPCYLFECSERVLGGVPISGVVWYQGESNAHNADTHTRLFQLLLQSWRTYWRNPELPFYYAQLSSLDRPSWTWFRDSQRRLLEATQHTGMAVTHDVGDSLDVHPTRKRPVGERLARWALHDTYGRRSCTPSGPLYRSMQVEGRQVVLHFDYADGLRTRGGEPVVGFEVAGRDALWHEAQVRIEGDRVVVWSDGVEHPVRVRYGWQPYTRANLVNAADLPASTFLTDLTDLPEGLTDLPEGLTDLPEGLTDLPEGLTDLPEGL